MSNMNEVGLLTSVELSAVITMKNSCPYRWIVVILPIRDKSIHSSHTRA
jgi:hypothetical protein